MRSNPFTFGQPLQGDAFLDRRQETRFLVQHIQKSDSIIITAEPRLGKTSLLHRIQNTEFYGPNAKQFHFCYLDAQTLAGWDIPRFWEYVLQFVKNLSPQIEEAYLSAQKEHFGTFVVERLFKQLELANEHLILLLDEFDTILDHPNLHTAEFYGGLRSLATRYSSLALIIASRQPIEELIRRTIEFSRSGSPYFNAMQELSLCCFSPKDTHVLLLQAGKRFDSDDRLFLERVSGGHPYCLQAAASYLWDAYENKLDDPAARRTWAGEKCFSQITHSLRDTWRTWTPYQQMAFTLATLDAMPRLLPNREFDIQKLLKDRPNFAPEQRILKDRGFLREAPGLDGGYEPQAEVMLWFLVDELTRLLRPTNPDLVSWLREQEWEGLLKHGEKTSIQKALNSLKPVLKEGALAFIKAAAEGLISKA